MIKYLIVLLLFAGASQALEVEAGPSYLFGGFSGGGTIVITERVGNWSFGGGYISKQYEDIEPNIFFQAHRIVDYRRWEFGLGPTYFQNTNRSLGTNLNIGLSIGYRGDRWSLRFRHWSNAGSGKPNHGQDTITIGYAF